MATERPLRFLCPEEGCLRSLQAIQQVFWHLDSHTNQISTSTNAKDIFYSSFTFAVSCGGGHTFPAFSGTTTELQQHLRSLAKAVRAGAGGP